MRWATAGHDLPIAYDPADDRFIKLSGSGMSLGLQKGNEYEEHLLTEVKPGQTYMASTDGLFEISNTDGEMFGKDRVRGLIRNSVNMSAD